MMTVVSPEELLKIYKSLPPPNTTITCEKDAPLYIVVSAEPKPIKFVYEGKPLKTIEEILKESTLPVENIIDKFFAVMKRSEVETLKINNYEYNKPVTKIDWSDGTTTRVSCKPDEADQFSGFLACICKKVFPDYLKEYEKYTETIPKQKAEEEAKKAEEQRRAEKRKAKRDAYKEKRRKIKAAKALAEQYQRELEEREIERIAQEKFGVPKSYFD